MDNLLTVNGAWYINQLPTMLVVELPDNSLAMFNMQVFKTITRADLKPYKGYNPRKVKGQPLPDYLYSFYGLRKNKESATEVIHVRLTPAEKQKVYSAAKNSDMTISEFVREWIRGL